MKIFWKATPITFLPVSIQNSNYKPIGEFKIYSEIIYLGEQYRFEYKNISITKILTSPNEIKVLNSQGDELAVISDPQWLKTIEIKLSDGNIFHMTPKISFGDNYLIKLNGQKIGEFKEQFFAFSPKGHVELDETQSNNIALIISVLYIGLHKRMLTH